jgi:thiosulfate dehydrogenase
MKETTMRTMAIATALALVGMGAGARMARSDERPKHAVPKAQHGGTVVGLCDGQTTTEVPVAPGKALGHDEAQRVSDELMAEWRRTHPDAKWDDAVAQNAPAQAKPNGSARTAPEATARPTTATKAPVATQPRGQGGTYGSYDARDELVWKLETEKFVAEGNAIFHDAKKLGGTIGISCDMCHPNGRNTHPETYPKYQVQLQRVALLRDMINWCIENPVKGKALPDDSRTMRALEAYILSQRKGEKLDIGKH